MLPAELAGDVASALALVHEAERDEVGATAVLAAATRGRARRELAALAAALARSAPLAEAMERAPSVFRVGDVAAVSAANGSAAREASVLRAVARRCAERAAVRRQLGQAAIYPAFVLVCYALASPAMLLVTDSVEAFARAAASSLAWLVAVAAGASLALAGASAIAPLRRAAQALAWRLPWLAAPLVHHRRAVWAAALGRALGAGMDRPTALRCATLVTGDPSLGDRIGAHAEAPATQGARSPAAVVDAADRTALSRSLVRSGVVNPTDALIATASEAAGDLAGSLGLLAARNAERRERSLRTATKLLSGALTVALLAQTALGILDAYQSFSLPDPGALPDLGEIDLPLSDLPLP